MQGEGAFVAVHGRLGGRGGKPELWVRATAPASLPNARPHLRPDTRPISRTLLRAIAGGAGDDATPGSNVHCKFKRFR
jgi:hypothetical protein